MPTAQPGDRVQVHYVLRLQDGSVASSRGRAPLELTVGTDHPRLPGLGLALVGLTPGEGTTLTVPPERAYGPSDPSRIRRCSRRRFPEHATLQPGRLVQVKDNRGRRRLVRILQVSRKVVVVDANHRWAGQTLEMEVQLVAIQGPHAGSEVSDPARLQGRPGAGHPAPEATSGDKRLPRRARAVAFDVDAASLAGLREALPGWEIDCVNGASAASLAPAWDPGPRTSWSWAPGLKATDTVGLCRFLAYCTSYSGDSRQERPEGPGPGGSLRNQPRRVDAPLLVLVPPGQETLVGAVLEAGPTVASSCPSSPRK
jgi:peptidylprolyl isomerase